MKVLGGISVERKEDLEFLKVLIEAGKFKPVIIEYIPWNKLPKRTGMLKRDIKKANVVINVGQGKTT